MKKNIARAIIAVLITVVVMMTFQSCSSIQSLTNDPYFREGFRQGWNSTAPEEYRY